MKDASDFIKRVLLNKHVQIAAGKAWPNRGYDTYRDAHNAASKYHQNFDVRSFVVSRDPVVLVYYCLGRKFLRS